MSNTLAQDILRDRLETLYTERERYGKHLDSVNEDIRDLEVAIAALADRLSPPTAESALDVTIRATPAPCDHKERGYLLWNEHNRAFQCHRCGEVFVPKFWTQTLTVPADQASLPEERVVHRDESGWENNAKVEFPWSDGDGTIKDLLLAEFQADPQPDPFEAYVPPAEAVDPDALVAAVQAALDYPPPPVYQDIEVPLPPTDDVVRVAPSHVEALRSRLRASADLVSERYDDTDDDNWEGA